MWIKQVNHVDLPQQPSNEHITLVHSAPNFQAAEKVKVKTLRLGTLMSLGVM